MKNLFGILFLSFFITKGFAQDPNWSLNPSNYQFSMTFTTSLNINGTTLSSPNDKVAAFINGEVRGVAGVTYIARLDKYVSYITVYANTNREVINFKIYNSTNDVVVDIAKTVNFSIDGNVGSAFQTLSLASPSLNNQALVTGFSFDGLQAKSISITANTIDVLLPPETDARNLTAKFITSAGAKVFLNNVKLAANSNNNNFTRTIKYQVVSEDEAVLKEYTLNVTVEVIVIVPNFTATLITSANTISTNRLVTVQLVLSQEVISVKREDFTLENAVLQTITKVNTNTYNLNLVALSQGGFSIQLPENKVATLANKGNRTTNKLVFTLDSQSPYLVSLLRKPGVSGSNSTDVAFTATFNELVTGVSVSDFETIPGATLSLQKENDTTYTITVGNIATFQGILSVRLKSTNNIKDFLGNPLRPSTYKNY
ncbi:MAG: hypothetical protein AB8B78_06320 [Polaribacter sp.]